MIKALRMHLQADEIRQRFSSLATDAPAGAPLSICVSLPEQSDQAWLNQFEPGTRPFWFHGRPSEAQFQLGLGQAFQLDAEGAQRFAALDHGWRSLCQQWRHAKEMSPPLAFCGFAFSPARVNGWPNARLAIPDILITQTGKHCQATITLAAGTIAAGLQHCLQHLPLAATAPPTCAPLLFQTTSATEDEAWLKRTRCALTAIDQAKLAKLVLCREIRLRQVRPVPVMHLLNTLCQQQPDATIYAHGTGRETFLGATPERLLRFTPDCAETMALAGTAWQGSPPLGSSKNRHEQSLVTEAILRALGKQVTALEITQPEAARAGRLTHWRTRIVGRPRPGSRCLSVLNALHPTPAVGGFPSDLAQAWLAQHEPVRSAWYSGGFGLLGAEGSGDFSVALRSALIRNEHILLQAGAGLVAGSVPEQELAETEAKLGTLLAALGHDRPPAHPQQDSA